MNSKSKVVNDRQRIDATGIVIDTVAYTVGDSVGGLWQFPKALGSEGSGVVEQITILDLDNQKQPMDIIFFNDAPLSGFTNNAAVTLAAGDRLKVIGWVPVLAADYTAIATTAIATVTLPRPFTLSLRNTSLYAIAVARGTPTFTGAANLLANIIVRKD